ESLGLGVKECILDGADGLGDDAAGARAGGTVELSVDALVLGRRLADDAGRQTLDHDAHTRRAEAFVEFTPADDACIRAQLDEMIVAPARIAGERFDVCNLHRRSPPAAAGEPNMAVGHLAAVEAAGLPTAKRWCRPERRPVGSVTRRHYPQAVRSSSPGFPICPVPAPAWPFWPWTIS